MKIMKPLTSLAYGLGLAMFAGGAGAHGLNEVGQPACLEANFMMADAMNAPFAAANGPGQVLEVNIVTGARGITVANPFGGTADPAGPVCENGSGNLECPGPFKPTGVLSGGLNGHAFITSAAQQALTQFHRNGVPIKTVSYRPLLGNPTGPAGRGSLPRPLGTQMMPNGNIVQAICDANFFNAQNSDSVSPLGNTHPSVMLPTCSSRQSIQLQRVPPTAAYWLSTRKPCRSSMNTVSQPIKIHAGAVQPVLPSQKKVWGSVCSMVLPLQSLTGRPV